MTACFLRWRSVVIVVTGAKAFLFRGAEDSKLGGDGDGDEAKGIAGN